MFSTLITTESLAQIIDNDDLVILDASIPPVGGIAPGQYSWPSTAIKGARRFDLEGDFSDLSHSLPHTMPSASQFEQAAQQLGINADSQIVVYDNLGIFSSARAWWMFKAMGHNKVAVLNGGLPKWVKEQRETVAAPDLEPKIGNFTATPQLGYFCDANTVLSATEQPSVAIIDARGSNRFLGQVAEPREGVRSGHIPHSLNLPFSELLVDGEMISAQEIRERYQQLLDDQQELIFSCGSGVTACVLALAADIVGYSNLCVYDGSWAEWGSNLNLPLADD